MAAKKTAKKPAAKAKKAAEKKPAAKPRKKPAAKKTTSKDVGKQLKELLGPASFRALKALGEVLVTSSAGKLSLNEPEAKAMAGALFSDSEEADGFVDLLKKAVKETQARSSRSTTGTPLV